MMPSATVSKPWGQGSETATGPAELVPACGVDASGVASDRGVVRGAVDDGRLRGQWSSRDEGDEDIAAAVSTSNYRNGRNWKNAAVDGDMPGA